MKYTLLFLFILLSALNLFGADFTDCTSGMVSVTPVPREKFTLSRKAFDAGFLALDCRVKSTEPVSGAVFIKDKDGNYFQSDLQWRFDGSGSWQTLRVPIDERNNHWRPFSNQEKWNAMLASGIFESGVSFWSERRQNVTCEVKNLRYEGNRRIPTLAITHFQVPQGGVTGKQLSAQFQLSREYFNAFDPAEIAVDCEWIAPNGEKSVFPAFFTQEIKLEYRLTRERTFAVGSPYWECRYLPRQSGQHRFRIVARDATDSTVSPWQTVAVAHAPFSGLVRVSRRNPAFFEYEDGTPFFPVGLNIHTNTDYRAETRLKLTPLADRGLKDFEDYFAQCSAAGINCIEIWMASWTFALEWSSRRHDYYGIGRYNLANAAKLDRLFELAERYGIRINLVFDNHGKFSDRPTQEWFENPFNKESEYVESDGGFLTAEDDFFASECYKEFCRRRNRYLAARYGQNPNIFAIELWSEVDLTIQFRNKSYPDGTCEKWHSEMIRDYQQHTPVRHLITTHVCGDINNNKRWIRLWELPEVSHLAGDAYRSDRIPMFDQMRKQYDAIEFPKPCLITEFGGSSSGNDDGKMEADLHAGLWSAIFKKQAGLPFLWWHDFVILGKRLHHFRGVTEFLSGVDVTNPEYERRECVVTAPPESLFRPFRLGEPGARPAMPWERAFGAMVLMRDGELIGWAFHNERLFQWRDRNPDLTAASYWRGVQLHLPDGMASGRWEVVFFDTLTGKEIAKEARELNQTLILPDFEDDIAFKLRRVQ